ncbi:hypothetical protein F4813DRAFT_394986 [Daldinia decipiens]|uniref:uncharacterized protein n=1 Tax=Daldinia decipiens TaxID=326647 RepID=UPI0020C2D2F3|nr:uncharacterized protein F4813DRAFT_394986 [Daldinia decipiens]KAI1662914.1 hypothetical protein F4813DRAFT_394986 [Daldinia decipiens]
MTNNSVPPMPLEASGNMTMSMSTTTATSRKLPMRGPVSRTVTGVQFPSDQSIHPSHTTTATTSRTSTTNSSSMANIQLNRTRSREKALNMERINLAGQLSDQQKLCARLEATIISLQDEVTSLSISKETLEAECERLHGQIHAADENSKSQTTEAEQREKALSDKITDLESRLNKILKSLEDTKYDLGMVQLAYTQVVNARNQQVSKVQQLELDLKADRAKIHDLNDSCKNLQEKNYNADLAIYNMEKSHQSRERELQQRLTSKGTEIKDLKRELNTLRGTSADAVAKKEAVQKELAARSDEFKAESQKLQHSFDELQKSTAPFDQTIVICVDVSGSVASVIHEVKQVYRDVLHIIKSNNSNAEVAVVVHGSYVKMDPSPTQTIKDGTFRILDGINSIGTEDYTYCMEQARNILHRVGVGSKKCIVLIGDGDAICSSSTSLFATCDQLKSANIQAHSVIITNVPNRCRYAEMRAISKSTGGRVEDKYTYLSAIEEILRHQREQHFKAL